MNPAEVLVPLTFFVSMALILGYSLSQRHKERMAMIEKGVSADQLKPKTRSWFLAPSPLSSLKWGIIIIAVGLGILIGNFLREVYRVDDSVVAGMIFLLAGIALIIFYFIAAKKTQDAESQQ
jgi:uncharacterized membrane protein YkgB